MSHAYETLSRAPHARRAGRVAGAAGAGQSGGAPAAAGPHPAPCCRAARPLSTVRCHHCPGRGLQRAHRRAGPPARRRGGGAAACRSLPPPTGGPRPLAPANARPPAGRVAGRGQACRRDGAAHAHHTARKPWLVQRWGTPPVGRAAGGCQLAAVRAGEQRPCAPRRPPPASLPTQPARTGATASPGASWCASRGGAGGRAA